MVAYGMRQPLTFVGDNSLFPVRSLADVFVPMPHYPGVGGKNGAN
jgi:hypothetical protein